jgi:hypothetical protein
LCNAAINDVSLFDDVAVLTELALLSTADARIFSAMATELLYFALVKKDEEGAEVVKKLVSEPRLAQFWSRRLPNLIHESLCSAGTGEVIRYDGDYGQFPILFCAANMIQIACKRTFISIWTACKQERPSEILNFLILFLCRWVEGRDGNDHTTGA